MDGCILGNQKNVRIGNNVFIGQKSIILCGSIIGDNTIIGAGSVVTGIVEGNSVYAGNPAKKIMTIEEYAQKRASKQLEEAVKIFKSYYLKYNKIPDKSLFHEYFMLFEPNPSNLITVFSDKLKLVDSYSKSINYMKNRKPPFDSYEEFVLYALKTLAINEIETCYRTQR